MTDLFFDAALLPTGWARAVRLTAGPEGDFTAVTPGSSADGAERVKGVAVPGVPNLHSHAFQRAMAGLTERGSQNGDSFWSWRERMYAFLARLEPEHVEAIAAQLYVEMLRHGFTAVAEFHYLRNQADGTPYASSTTMALQVLAGARRAGIGLTLLPTLYRASDFGGKPATPGQRRFLAGVDELLTDVTSLRREVADDPECHVGLALHSLRAVPPDALDLAVTGMRAVDPEAPIHIHAAEQRREVEACVSWSGARPVEWLLDHAPVDERWCVVHATHMTVEETLALAGSGAVVGLCPTTEANLGDGLFAFEDYVSSGGVWGVGTDSHVSVSPVAELRMLEYGQRLRTYERNVAAGQADRSTGRALLESAWKGGAMACGRPLGALAQGRRADLVVLDPEHTALVGRSDDELLDAWIFNGEDTPVTDVMVGGRWAVRDRRHPEQEAVAERFRETARALAHL